MDTVVCTFDCVVIVRSSEMCWNS